LAFQVQNALNSNLAAETTGLLAFIVFWSDEARVIKKRCPAQLALGQAAAE
jgi:hypothetical protein